MKVITTNLLNYFWKNGVKPIKDAVGSKLDASKVANNLTTTVAGYALDARQGRELNNNKLSVTNVANNLATTQAGYALDARQGKALEDKIAALNGKLTTKVIKPNLSFSTAEQTYDLNADEPNIVIIYISPGTNELCRTLTLKRDTMAGFYIYGDADYNLKGYVKLDKTGVLTYRITYIKGWIASAFKIESITIC